jgi:hypothetical protein
MEFNMQSRLYYDQDAKHAHEINSEKTLKWFTSDIQQNRSLATANTLEVDVLNKIYKAETARDTDRDGMNAELFGTSPFLGRLPDGNSNNIVVESNLLHGGVHRVHNCWNKQTHEPNYIQVMPTIQVESQRGGASTRNEGIRYCNGK